MAQAILKLVINTDLTSFLQCLTDYNRLSYMERVQNTFGKEWGRGRSGTPMGSKIHPALLHKTDFPHHVRTTRESSTAHTSTSCAAVTGDTSKGCTRHHEQVHTEETQAPGPPAAEEQQGLCLAIYQKEREPDAELEPLLTKRSHQEKVLNSLLSNHSCSTLFQ